MDSGWSREVQTAGFRRQSHAAPRALVAPGSASRARSLAAVAGTIIALAATTAAGPALGPMGPGPGPVAAATPTAHPPIEGFTCPDQVGEMKVVRAEWFGTDDMGEVYCEYERYVLGERSRLASVKATWSDPDICARPGPDEVTTVLPAATDQPQVLDVGPITQVEKRAPGRMAWVYYRTSQLAERGMIEVLAEAFLAEAARRSPACPGASPTPEADCVFRGTVTDGGWEDPVTRVEPGHPIRGARVAILDVDGDELADGSTDRTGAYSLLVPVDALVGFDPALDPIRIRVRLLEIAHEPSRYEVLVRRDFRSQQAEVDSDAFTWEEECDDGLVERDFPLGDLPLEYSAVWPPVPVWEHIAEIYDRVGRAFDLVDLLKIRPDDAPPLPIYTMCTGQLDFRGQLAGCASREGFWMGTLSDTPDEKYAPFVALGTATSLVQSGGWPDNREYHELGHAILADAFGNAMPNHPEDVNHAGYFENPSSTDSWTEGFAEWFSAMVTKHVDGRPRPEIYRLSDGIFDLELDYRPWLAQGWAEEVAIAGLLFDLEDGPADYAAAPAAADLRLLWHTISTDWAGNRFVVGRVRNESPHGADWHAAYSEMTMVAAVFYDDQHRPIRTAWGPTIPWDLPGRPAPDAEIAWPVDGLFVIPIPAGLSWAELGVVAFEGRPGTTSTDDDPVDLDLAELWDAIVVYGSTQADANGYLFDVADLYGAIRARFDGRDADRNGMDDVDQVFVAHGFFADPDGDRSWRHGDPIGRSDNAGQGAFPGRSPRRDLEPFPGARVRVDAGGVGVGVLVTVSFPDRPGYGFLVRPDADGRVAVIPPPPGSGGNASLTVLADGYLPALAGVIEADTFWAAVDTGPPGALGPAFTVTMTPGTVTAPREAAPAGLLVGGGGLAAAAAAALLLLRRRTSREARR